MIDTVPHTHISEVLIGEVLTVVLIIKKYTLEENNKLGEKELIITVTVLRVTILQREYLIKIFIVLTVGKWDLLP